jgi:putative MATE family efflux protein
MTAPPVGMQPKHHGSTRVSVATTTTSQPHAQAAKVAAVAMSPRTRAMLEGAILPTLLRLIAGNLTGTVTQAVVGLMGTFYISWLGADAVAGVTLVFPLFILMTTMSGGGVGGAVSGVVARTLGAGRPEAADAVALHAIALGFLLGAVFTAAELLGGPALFRAMGATGGTLQAAIAYGGVLFAGISALWLYNILNAILRGAGTVRLSAIVTVVGAAVTLSLSPAMILGWGPFPQFGIVGAALVPTIFYVGATIFLAVYLLSGRTPINPLRRIKFETRLFWQILRIGLPAAVNTSLTSSTLLLIAWLVASFGSKALAGYGIASRLETGLSPVLAGIGASLVAMVGSNIGAGQLARAQRITWIGACLAGCLTAAIGVFGFFAPGVWIGIFSNDAAVLDAGTRYLHTVGPAFAFLGIANTLFFASLGAGRPFWPLCCAFLRLVTTVGGGAVAGFTLGGGLDGISAAMVVGLIVYGGGTALAIRLGAWRR